MNRLYVTSHDGRVFFADSDSDTFELLDPQNPTKTLVKRLSTCSWSIWAVTSNFHLQFYTHTLDTPFTHTFTTFENQRRYNLLSASSFTSKLLFTDRSKFSSQDGLVDLPKENFCLPSSSWEWNSEWLHEVNVSDGWEYALDFPNVFRPAYFAGCCVRRRKWSRSCKFTKTGEWLEIKGPEEDESINDVSCGGSLMPYTPNGFICVWIVTIRGNIYLRQNVSWSNLEGKDWLQVKLPESVTGILSCNCSTDGSLWVIDYEYNAFMRTGISRDCPQGIHWIQIENGRITSGIRQISLGNKSVWALDSTGDVFFRSGLGDDRPEGLLWVHIPANMSYLSVSHTDQVWGIDANENFLCFRLGINLENPHGIGWQRIDLKCRRITRSSNLDQISSLIQRSDDTQILDNFKPKSEDWLPQGRDSQHFIPRSKIKEPDCFIDIYDIYNGDICNDGDTEKDIYPLKALEEEQEINTEPTLTEMDLNRFDVKSFSDVTDLLSETSGELDEIIAKSKDFNSLKESRAESRASLSSSLDDVDIQLGDKSGCSGSSLVSVESESDELQVTGFRSCSADFFELKKEAKWFYKNSVVYEVRVKLEELYRSQVLRDLKLRNIRENMCVDKVSVMYQNVSSQFELTWSRSETFFYLHTNKLKSCQVEVITGDLKQSDRFNERYKFKGPHHNFVTLKIKSDLKSMCPWEIRLNLKDFILVTRWIIDNKTDVPCFAIFTRQNTQHVFSLLSERVLIDWQTQLTVFSSRVARAGQKYRPDGNNLHSAATLTNKHGYGYYAFLSDNRVEFIRQIEGHMRFIEKHLSGITFGVGVNGKLWLLDSEPNEVLDSYRGPYVQIDEKEVCTYENQRWNAAAVVLRKIGASQADYFPILLLTDRFNWSDETGKEKRLKEEFKLPSRDARWYTGWQVDFLTDGGVDKDGWQYALDFPFPFNGVRRPLKDFVRRRRWQRKYRVKSSSTLWKEVPQINQINCLAMDMESESSNLLPKGTILAWAVDSEGALFVTLINKVCPGAIRWQHVSGSEAFSQVTIGVGLKVWGVSATGCIFYRYGVDKRTNYCGSSWSLVESSDKEVIRFKQVSAGKNSVWAVSTQNVLYFRENITKSFPEGTAWSRVDARIKHVSVSWLDQVCALTSSEARECGMAVWREGVDKNNLKGSDWRKMISIKAETISIRGVDLSDLEQKLTIS